MLYKTSSRSRIYALVSLSAVLGSMRLEVAQIADKYEKLVRAVN